MSDARIDYIGYAGSTSGGVEVALSAEAMTDRAVDQREP